MSFQTEFSLKIFLALHPHCFQQKQKQQAIDGFCTQAQSCSIQNKAQKGGFCDL